ncbi:MAG: hypothetical protein COB15_04815 [Flavobacteriales bacterium]|nr:MAG: hypothetical protein COB15_04815 [Flavobacteriales bacterium]
MSSPIVDQKSNSYKEALVKVHKKISHSTRISIIANKISKNISSHFPEASEINCLDVGTGDMTIAELIGEISPSTNWKCIDIHELPKELKNSEKWKKYQQFDGNNIPFPNNSFDISVFSDVLHHTGDSAPKLIAEAARVSKYIVIKDHFEYSFYSRSILKLMDIVGNWGYGVSIPKRYFSKKSFESLVDSSGLKIVDLNVGVRLYDHLPIVKSVLNPKWQFIAVLTNK